MFHTPRTCKLSNTMMIRLNNFLYIFNLRQGTILIAVHQIALSSFVLIILLVGISHVGEMLSMLYSDMEDEVERRGLYEMADGEFRQRGGDLLSTNNQKRFAKAHHLASVTVIFLYTSTVLTSIYLMCCISLLHGAVRCRREYVLPWLVAATLALALLLAAAVLGDSSPPLVQLFGGHNAYHLGCALFVLTFVYAICAVCSFALETRVAGRAGRGGRGARGGGASDERGERVLLLDHAAHSTLLSAHQINKHTHNTHFV